MAASYFGGEVKETRRYKVGKLLGTRTRNLLLMSATPHNGKEADFQLFMACSMQIGSTDASVESMRISGVLTPPPAQRDPRCRCPGRESQQIYRAPPRPSSRHIPGILMLPKMPPDPGHPPVVACRSPIAYESALEVVATQPQLPTSANAPRKRSRFNEPRALGQNDLERVRHDQAREADSRGYPAR